MGVKGLIKMLYVMVITETFVVSGGDGGRLRLRQRLWIGCSARL